VLQALRPMAPKISLRSCRAKLQLLKRFIDRIATVLFVGVSPDHGMGTESYIEKGLADHANVTALVYPPVAKCVFGMPAVRGEARALPFADNSFYFLVSSAVIEHIGGLSGTCKMLGECARVGLEGWLHTTPNRRFPVELHTGMPILHWLTRPATEGAFRLTGRIFNDEQYHQFTASSLRKLGIPGKVLTTSKLVIPMTIAIASESSTK